MMTKLRNSAVALAAGTLLALGSAIPAQAWTVAAAPPGGAWSGASNGVSLWGSNGLRISYQWQRGNGLTGLVCAEAKGYVNGVATWFGAGCGVSGSVNVPWGNVLAVTQMRFRSISGIGVGVTWQ